MYVRPNYASLRLLKDAVEAGDTVEVFYPIPGPLRPSDGLAVVQGPHDTQPSVWWARVKVEGGRVVKVIS